MKKKSLLKRIAIGLTATAGLAGLAILGPPAYVKTQDAVNEKRIEQEISQLEKELTERCGIEVEVWKEPALPMFGRPEAREFYSLRPFSPYVSLKALEGLEDVLKCYPADIIKKNFSGIRIVKSFVKPWYGESWEKQDITPLAKITFGGNVYISAGRDESSIFHQALFDKIFDKGFLHHELGHELTRDLPEEEWKALNPEAKYFPDSWKQLPNTPAGFYNKYAASSIGEDIATTVELLYSGRDNYERVTGRDPILKSKAEFLKAWYHKVSNGRFDQKYWDSIQSGKTPQF